MTRLFDTRKTAGAFAPAVCLFYGFQGLRHVDFFQLEIHDEVHDQRRHDGQHRGAKDLIASLEESLAALQKMA